MRNRDLKFICKEVSLKVANDDTAFTKEYNNGQVINIPVAHHDGNFFADSDVLKEIEDNQQVAFRYCDKDGEINEGGNPNGSLNNIAGVFNKSKRILGMMPHPERAADGDITGGTDGRALFSALLENLR
jgi:phosphoribosylformylglycinamidine synthase